MRYGIRVLVALCLVLMMSIVQPQGISSASISNQPSPEDGIPLSGQWLVTYGDDLLTNCPDVLTLDEAPHPLEFHEVVAPDEISAAPEFFMTTVIEGGVYGVAPGIQGQPFTYRYTVNDAQTITLEYTQTLSLSDCELTLTITLTRTGDAPMMAPVTDWVVLGDADEVFGPDDEFLCSAPHALDSVWLFDAPESFVDHVVAGYGETLAFDLRRRDAVQTPTSATVTLVVGNAILLNYDLPEAVTDEFTRFEIPLTEAAGWYDVDGMFDASFTEMFLELLSDVTRVQISESGTDSDGFCLRNPAVGDMMLGDVPYYVIGQTDDGGGIPVGCEGYMLPLDSGQPFSDDPVESIRASLEPLLAMPSTEVEGTAYTNYLGGQGLSLGEVTVSDGHATVVIEGSFLLLGACADPQIEAQFLLGIFADPRIETATVITNGENLKAVADMSGQTPEDAVYTRNDIRRRTW
jgi:hypothetical protein